MSIGATAYGKGRAAFVAGLTAGECPYSKTELAGLWRSGWLDASELHGKPNPTDHKRVLLAKWNAREPMSQDEIGCLMGVSRTTISAIEQRALEKIRAALRGRLEGAA